MGSDDPLIVETIRVSTSGFDLSAFVLDISSTAIGAVLGFGFALILNWIQQRALAKERAAELRAKATATLKLTVHVCAANIETLANFKSQYALGLAADAGKLKPFLEAHDIAGAVNAMSGLDVFFKALSDLAFLDLPPDADFTFSIDDVPPLNILLHRSYSTAKSLNARILSRNNLIAEQAKANGRGMKEQEVVYFSMMLLAEADNILEVCDQALFFFDLLHDQVHNYGKYRFAEGEFRKFELVEKMKPMMPPKDFLKGYREQFIDFDPEKDKPAT